MTDEHVARGIDNFGVRGTGDSPSDVKFVFPEGNAGAPDPSNYVMFWVEAGQGILFENFEIHQTDDRRTAASIVAWAGDASRYTTSSGRGSIPSPRTRRGVAVIRA